MIDGIKAVAFDIDGTLYPSLKLYLSMTFYVFKHLKFYLKFSKVRRQLHRTAPLADFYEYQARLFAHEYGCSAQEAKQMIHQICYIGMKPYFKKMKPFPHVVECIKAFKAAGLKIGILSDFPPEQKDDIWGIRDLCDVCLGSEQSGALKPSLYPFGILAKELKLNYNEILYVGNSRKCDVHGATNAGMKTAFVQNGFFKLFNIKSSKAVISFSDYRKLRDFVLK